MPIFNGYSYRPLSHKDAIRLVILYPSTNETAPLTCRIIEHRLSTKSPKYSAVSYVWGKHKLSQTLEIRCDGDVRYLRITPNVETVLRGLQKHNKPQYLWIDAICFNQNDEVEKAQQIPIMGNIYKKALAVDIWLGPENDMTVKVLAFFRELSRLPDVTKWRTQWELAKRIASLTRAIIPGDTSKGFNALFDFFEQPWFSRHWVIQEACLARRGVVHCGKQSISLLSLNKAAICFQRMDLSDYALKVAANLGRQTTDLSMLELLWHFHDSKCLEPKDRIAAFLGLARDRQKLCLDYTKPWDKIFKDFASLNYNLGHNNTRLQLLLHLFEFGSVSKKEDPSYPSWVPDWSRSRQRRLPYISAPKNVDTFEQYPSSPGHSGKATIAFNHGYLQIDEKPSGVGLHSLRVASTITFHCFRGDEDFEKQQAGDVIEKLFPCIAEAELHIVALTVLLGTVSEFRHSPAERETTSKPLGRFEKALEKHLKTSDCRKSLRWLRTLESVLRDFCLVELKSSDPDSTTLRGYGIATELIRVDDIAIPLWNWQADHPRFGLHMGALDPRIQLSTMLVVRHIGMESKDDLDEPGPFQECKIIGPLICVTWSQASNDGEFQSESGQGHFVNHEHRFPIRIR